MPEDQEETVENQGSFPMPVGWECPKCGKAIAPFMSICPYCADSAREINSAMEKDGVVRVVGGGKESGEGMIKES